VIVEYETTGVTFYNRSSTIAYCNRGGSYIVAIHLSKMLLWVQISKKVLQVIC
jgi:energy-converting hydrogenase Eha subunit H